MKKRLIYALLPLVAIALELSPLGAVLSFANPEGKDFCETYSYFSLMPFGYANFGPFLTAILSCVLLVLMLIYVFTAKETLKTVGAVVCFVACGTSLMPFLFGVKFFSLVGLLISLSLFAQLMLALFGDRTKE